MPPDEPNPFDAQNLLEALTAKEEKKRAKLEAEGKLPKEKHPLAVKLDPKTRFRIVAGMAGVTLVILGVSIYRSSQLGLDTSDYSAVIPIVDATGVSKANEVTLTIDANVWALLEPSAKAEKLERLYDVARDDGYKHVMLHTATGKVLAIRGPDGPYVRD